MKKTFLKLTLLILALAIAAAPITANAAPNVSNQTSAAIKLKEDMRKLWTDHTIWTRSYVVSSLAGLEDQEKVLARLLRNQTDIGNAIKPYYGEKAGNTLASLLQEHIMLAGSVVGAAKAGDQANLKKFNKEWYRNADDIALFLSNANPNWSNEELKKLLYMHLQLLTDAVLARIKKDWAGDIIAYDKGEDHILLLADTLSRGIIKQFPKKFK